MLFTKKLSDRALAVLENWFGKTNVQAGASLSPTSIEFLSGGPSKIDIGHKSRRHPENRNALCLW